MLLMLRKVSKPHTIMNQKLIDKLFYLDTNMEAVVKAYIGNAQLTNAQAVCIYMQHVIVNMSQRVNVGYNLVKVRELTLKVFDL
ncbi:hypothetical protein D1Q00_gp060 [Trichoplusia ni granulovirus LBIV-12]|uniref:Uncharacterized protein n=1 Tax=Trichoplusia ni granulovirus LBIV-12 TaxID=1916701 RepID=A0A1D8QL74_GVTN|nr:hypothetical protein D1Q00_gp060 [Trichoplusia ni granulovirus LBIV-12]AOW41399.1 hypothetical protein [Trichoplusia ni granulovirus LBIV-12]